MDANVFLSSLAQSVAAIAGILAAFAISRLIADQADFRAKKARTRSLLAESRLLADRVAHTSFGWYSFRHDLQMIDALERALADGATLDAEELFRRTPFSPFTPRESNFNQVLDLVSYWRGPLAANMLKSYNIKMESISTTAMADQKGQQLREERQVIDAVVSDARRHVHSCREHLADLRAQSQSSSAVIATIVTSVVLFYVGVIYPLSFMPMRTGEQISFSALTFTAFWPLARSLRGVMLAVPTVVITLAAAFAIFTTRYKLRYRASELDELAHFATWDAYSKFLVTWEENQAEFKPPVAA